MFQRKNNPLQTTTATTEQRNKSNRGSEEEDEAAAAALPSSASRSTAAMMASSTSRRPKKLSTSVLLILIFVLALLLVIAFALRQRLLSKLALLRILTLLPVAVCAYLTYTTKNRNTWQGGGAGDRILPLALVSTVVSAQFPSFLGKGIAAASIVAFSLKTLPQNHGPATDTTTMSTSKSPTTVLLATILLVTVLLTENFMVWVVSATFVPGQRVETAPPPLQDNGQILLQRLLRGITKSQVVSLRRLLNCQWALVACLGASFVVVEVFENYTCNDDDPRRRRRRRRRHLYSLGTRAVLTLAAARFIRTVSFLLTVLPSQHVNCYAQHYPSPPPPLADNTWEWIKVGLVPASHGGCNDLIISGHATVTSTLACVAASVSTQPLFQAALWGMLILDYAVEIYEGFHYSVDMWLGLVLVCLLWRVLSPIEEETTTTTTMETSETRTTDSETTTTRSTLSNNKDKNISFRDMILYSIPAAIAYLQATVLPQFMANGLIVLYIVAVTVLYVGFSLRSKDVATRQAYQHYAQHVLLCLLFMALAIYL